MSKRLEQWRTAGRHEELRKILSKPVMQEALAILREHAEPSHLTIKAAAVKGHEDASFLMAMTSALQSGVSFTLKELDKLATVPPEKKTDLAPYDHITEHYFDHGN